MELDLWDQCLGMVGYGTAQLKRGDFATARQALGAVLVHSRRLPELEARDMQMLAVLNLSQVLKRQGQHAESEKLRNQAAAVLAADPRDRDRPPAFLGMMGDALNELGDFKSAIPFYEECVAAIVEDEPTTVADLLWRTGQCYSRCGLRDHAAIPLRAATKVFRAYPEDPRYPVVLVALGNALRKSTPAEAEACYQQAAEAWVSRGHLESAAAAWVNLGVVCSEQERLDEALAYYQRALKVREAAAGTPPERLGILHNNIANCYRRMRQFSKAWEAAERSASLLEGDRGTPIAYLHGTRGLICRDEGRNEEAVQWFRRSQAQHEGQPSPNLEMVAEELENEASALRCLGRESEASAAEDRASSLRSTIAGMPQVGRELDALGEAGGGAVFIELPIGMRPGYRGSQNGVSALANRLWEMVEEKGIGRYGGTVATPESSTIMFYGAEAEGIYRTIERELLRERLCDCARVTIRQDGKRREVVLGPVM